MFVFLLRMCSLKKCKFSNFFMRVAHFFLGANYSTNVFYIFFPMPYYIEKFPRWNNCFSIFKINKMFSIVAWNIAIIDCVRLVHFFKYFFFKKKSLFNIFFIKKRLVTNCFFKKNNFTKKVYCFKSYFFFYG